LGGPVSGNATFAPLSETTPAYCYNRPERTRLSDELVTNEIDWAKLAEELELEAPFGDYCCGREDAQRALELIIGEAPLRGAVDYYVAGRPGSELARLALCQLRPWSAMRRCYETFKGDDSAEARRMAVELLRVLADRRALVWIPEFLADEDPLIQTWGIGVLDQLLSSELIEAGRR
jgi:hypothetical protein